MPNRLYEIHHMSSVRNLVGIARNFNIFSDSPVTSTIVPLQVKKLKACFCTARHSQRLRQSLLSLSKDLSDPSPFASRLAGAAQLKAMP